MLSASRLRNACVFIVEPVQILEDQHQEVVKRFAQQHAFDCLQCAAAPYLRTHLRERFGGSSAVSETRTFSPREAASSLSTMPK
jgi:hypothetical protein